MIDAAMMNIMTEVIKDWHQNAPKFILQQKKRNFKDVDLQYALIAVAVSSNFQTFHNLEQKQNYK